MRTSTLWGFILISCLFFHRTLLPSPFPACISQAPLHPQHWTVAQMGECLSLPIESHLSTAPHVFSPPTPFTAEDLALKLKERSELTQDKWHSKDGYKEDIHSGCCSITVKVKKEITAFPTKLSPPPALLQSREGAAATLLSGGGIPLLLADGLDPQLLLVLFSVRAAPVKKSEVGFHGNLFIELPQPQIRSI